MKISGLIREVMYLTGYYNFRFRHLLKIKNIKLGHLLFSIEKPEKVTIKAKLLGADGIRAAPVKISQHGNASIVLEEDVSVRRGVSISATGSGEIRICSGTTIGKNSTIETYGRAGVFIGEKCRISWNCMFLPSDEHLIELDGQALPFEKDIYVGNHVWIGTRAIILKGTIIGDNSIVAAGAVCSGEYPKNSLIAGVPGKVIKSGVNWRNLTKEELCLYC